jgi:hypothetical protein
MNEPTILPHVQQNWQRVVAEVSDAAQRCGRDPDSIRIIGVSKYVDTETTAALVEAGCRQLGESRPQSLWQKAEALADHAGIGWHLIGHLQRNKVRRVIRHRPLIHSVDSDRLLRAIAEESLLQAIQSDVLLEVNISGEETKTGLPPAELARLLERGPVAGVRVLGLMAMAGWGTDPELARQQFERTRQLRDELERRCGVKLPELSMGMSGDFAEAIASGATMVRIGSRLFEGL